MTATPAPIRPTTPIDVAPVGDRGKVWRRRIAYGFLIAYALLMFVPFAWMVITSFKTQVDAVQMTFIPDPVTLQGWQNALTTLNPNIVRLFINSAIIAGTVTVTNVVLGSMAGYAFARLRFPGREALFILVLGTMMIPDQLRMVPVYQLMRQFGLTVGPLQYVAVILVLAIAAISVFLLRQYFLSIPRDLEEAAKIDGAGFFTTFWRVMLPLATPAIAAVAILQFQGSWNGFFWPLILISDRSQYTLPLGLSFFRQQFQTQYPELMAVSISATIPILVLYLFFQRYFVEGIAASGVKG
ncbi:MAG TPA: carbohydrate ABC transporter permease [Candidatus Limnocylindria bacterium]|jgi:multiple sugar transport system permease protein|nr:carbohydrate ABC transporter permease [Candidatus Limnocylindria bacterium]